MNNYYCIGGLRQSLVAVNTLKKPKCKGPFSVDPMNGVCPTQDTSHMRIARVKQEEEANTRIVA